MLVIKRLGGLGDEFRLLHAT